MAPNFLIVNATDRLMKFNFDMHKAYNIFFKTNSKEKRYNVKTLWSELIDIFIMLLSINICIFKIFQSEYVCSKGSIIIRSNK